MKDFKTPYDFRSNLLPTGTSCTPIIDEIFRLVLNFITDYYISDSTNVRFAILTL